MCLDLLSEMLYETEGIYDVIFGICEKTMGLAVITDKRLVFVGSMGVLKKTVTEQFNYDKISSLSYNKGWTGTATIKFAVSGNKIEISAIKPEDAQRFCQIVNEKIDKSHTSNHVIAPSINIADELQKLATLKEQGFLTFDEFEMQKKKLLNL